MSSHYNWICLSHNPAIQIENPQYQSFNETTGAITNEDKPEDHKQCDLIMGRTSGGLVELVCTGCERHSPKFQKWIDTNWLRLLNRVYRFNMPSFSDPFTFRPMILVPYSLTLCWHSARLNKLFTLECLKEV